MMGWQDFSSYNVNQTRRLTRKIKLFLLLMGGAILLVSYLLRQGAQWYIHSVEQKEATLAQEAVGSFRILYSSSTCGVCIYDQLGVHPLSEGREPVLSPDGKKIAYTSPTTYRTEEIFVMNVDGSDPVRITTTWRKNSELAWSPDGTQIVFISDKNTHEDVFIVNIDGSGLTNLTHQDTLHYSSPMWTPDGEILYIVEEKEVVIMAKDGSHPHVLPLNFLGAVLSAKLSPDGTKLALAAVEGKAHLYIFLLDGTELARIDDPTLDYDDLHWSGDGTQLIFTVRQENLEKELDIRHWIYQMNADGTGLITISLPYI